MPKRPSNIYRLLGIRRNSWAAVALAVLLLLAAELHNTAGGDGGTSTREPDIGMVKPPNDSEMLGDMTHGQVIKVADGDTITLLNHDGSKLKIRMLGIDAPERNQKHGLAAGQWLKDRLLNKKVALNTSEKDRYGRIVAKVWAARVDCREATCPLEEDINLTLVKLGHAWWYKAYAKNQPKADRAIYEQAQQMARRERLGLWAHPEPLPPWEFRRKQRAERNP